MRWKTESLNEERARKDAANRGQWLREREWHRWFAWYPVKLGELCEEEETAWLCFVDRRLWGWHQSQQPEFYYWDIRIFTYRKIEEPK